VQEFLHVFKDFEFHKEMCGICLVFFNESKSLISDSQIESLYSSNKTTPELCIEILKRLQHRGRQMTKIITEFEYVGGLGTVEKVYGSAAPLPESLFTIGHVRYTTSSQNRKDVNIMSECQPFDMVTPFSERIIIAHNGQLGGTPKKYLKTVKELKEKGYKFKFNTDTEIFLGEYCLSKASTPKERILDAFQKVTGSATIVGVIIKDDSKACYFFGGRNNGNRPLFTGKIFPQMGKKDNSFYLPTATNVFTSEDYMYGCLKIQQRREVPPGCILWYDGKNSVPEELRIYYPNPKHCIFELFYFSHPISTFREKQISTFRKAFGEELFQEHPLTKQNWDIVMGVPDSGNHCALGFSQTSKIPFDLGIIRNHFANQRSFIGENSSDRSEKARQKYIIDPSVVNNKNVIIVDDSLVRSTTCTILIELLRDVGTKKIAFLLASPPIRYPNYYGIDIQDKNELAAGNAISIPDIQKKLKLDYLGYLSLEGARKRIDNIVGYSPDFCTACFTGDFW